MAKGEEQIDRHFERQRKAKQRRKEELPGEDEAPLPPPVEPIMSEEKEPGRNEPCPCGSGKKYKHCCLKKR